MNPPEVEASRLRLILLSFLMLFVELVLIRWAGSNIVFLGYFSNFVLLGSFLGIGVGFLRANRTRDLFPYASVGLALLVLIVFLLQVRLKIGVGEVPGNFKSPGATGLPIWVILPIVFAAVATVMAMIGEGVARTFKKFQPLEAYRLDIIGSLIGIAAFALLSFLSASPIAWGAIVVGAFILLYLPKLTWYQGVALLALLVVLGLQSFGAVRWSPYYRIDVLETGGEQTVWINGRPHQVLASTDHLLQSYPEYSVPFASRTAATPPGDVLIIGAGVGADTQVALARGAEHIDAVEIDPGIHGLGVEMNPDRVYSDPRVSSYVTDGRSFLEKSDKKYDVIIFALPDSLTLIAGNAGVRLESYLFTEEAVQAAKDHLQPNGIFVLAAFFREGFAAERVAGALEDVFGIPPCRAVANLGVHQDVFLVSAEPGAFQCLSGEVWQPTSTTVAPATDDHPFPYIKGRSIPAFYLVSIGLLLLVSAAAVRVSLGPLRQMRPYADLFFMGAAFLLLETKSVVQFALLFGTTWFVNALVFGGVLLTVLASIEVARRVELKRPRRLYIALFVWLGLAWVIPYSWLLSLPFALRVVAAIVVAFTPLFLANLVFAERFRGAGSSTVAFGANLLGAMVGGMMEYAALLIGYRGLTLLAAAFYALAWVFGAKHLLPGLPRETA